MKTHCNRMIKLRSHSDEAIHVQHMDILQSNDQLRLHCDQATAYGHTAVE